MYSLKIIIASTRPGRKGPAIASWIFEKAEKYKDWNVKILDLGEINLPLMNEPAHPRFKTYIHDHTKKWSKEIEEADGYIFVTSEYNYGFPAPLKNAIDYLHQEWNYKPVGFVSYGGIAGGTRAVQMLKLVVTTLKMVPLFESVNIPFFTNHIDDNNKFNSNESFDKASEAMLNELLQWMKNLKSFRENK